METKVLILAAGEGKRMKSHTPKVLHKICGRSMIDYIIDAASSIDKKPIVIIGHEAEKIQEHLGDSVEYVLQKEQKGTGHAVMMCDKYLDRFEGYVVVIAGDMPLLKKATIKKLIDFTKEKKNAVTIVSTILEDPENYGRIVRDENNKVTGIVEHRDATAAQREIKEINSSIYCFDNKLLQKVIKQLQPNNKQNEYYLTDCIEILHKNGEKIDCLQAPSIEMFGVNDKAQLAYATKIMRQRINNFHMLNGVTILDPETTYIDFGAKIEKDVIIYPGNIIEGETMIKSNTILLQGNYIEGAIIAEGCKIGPNSHLRPKTVIAKNCKIGNFVELKNVTVNEGAKIPHLSYCGDGEIGKRSNISCGVIFSNYDGKKKSQTIVGDDVFVGCNANLVAPVNIEDNAYIAAGSTITQDVPEKALAIARAHQQNKEGWVDKRNKK